MALSFLHHRRVVRAKRAFSTRRVPESAIRTLLSGDVRPMPGDLVLARVDQLGKHTKLELTDGRRAHLFPGDEIIVAFGNRYAPDQYEAVIGSDLSPCDLVAAGGIASIELSRHAKMLPSTKITPLGLLCDGAGERLNLSRFSVEADCSFPTIPIILSLGTSMNAGKTLTATSIVRGLRRHAFRVAALKITGTGAGGDVWIVRDAGADMVADFTDAGFASTYLVSTPELERGCYRLLNHVAAAGCDIAVVEIADGLQQQETAALIRSEAIQAVTLGTVFASFDAMGAKCGVDILRETGHHLLGLSGRLGMSPLGVREAENATGLRFFSPRELQEGALVPAIRRRAAEEYRASGETRGYLRAIAEMSTPVRASWHAMNGSLSSATDKQAAVGDSEGHRLGSGSKDSQSISDGASPARALLGTVARHLMEIEVAEQCGAAFGVRKTGRRNYRNGSRQIIWENPVGPIVLNIPRLRQGRYVPSFLTNSAKPSISTAIQAAIDALGTAEMENALRRLLKTIGGQSAERADLQVLASAVAKLAQIAPGDMPRDLPRDGMPVMGRLEPENHSDSDEAEDDAIAFANSFRVEQLPVMHALEDSDPSEGPTFNVHLLQSAE